jgi:hypothetical protein
MKGHYVTIFVLITYLNSCAQEKKINTSSKEPKSTFELKINGKNYLVKEDEELKLDTVLSKPSITIRLSAFKKFDISSISFDYPRYFTFEYSEDVGFKNWTLSGNNIVVMIFEIDPKTSLDALLDEMIKKFGVQNCVVENFQKELGNKSWNGKRLKVTLVGEILTLDFYEIILADGKSRFITFQDSKKESGSSTEEYKKGFSTIDSTIIFK